MLHLQLVFPSQQKPLFIISIQFLRKLIYYLTILIVGLIYQITLTRPAMEIDKDKADFTEAGIPSQTNLLPIEEYKNQFQNIATSKTLNKDPIVRSPEHQTAGLLSRLTLNWNRFFINTCHERKIKEDEIYDIEGQDEPFVETHTRWDQFWNQAKKNQDITENNGDRLKWTLKKTFQKELISASIMSFISHQCNAFSPLILYLISDYIKNGGFTYGKSIMFLVLIFGLKLIKIFLAMHSEFILRKVGTKVFSCICFAMTEKALAGGRKTAKSLSISEVSKLAQYDCSKLIEYPMLVEAVYLEFYSFFFSVGCLCYIAGWQGFVSCVVLLVLQVLRYALMGFFKQYQKKMNEEASKRITASTETVNNIKFVKVNALQHVFFKKLTEIRESEVSFLKKYLNIGILATVLQAGASRYSILVFIGLYVATGHQIEPTLIFSVILFFHFMALHKILNKANTLEDVNISFAKIQDYLMTQARDYSHIVHQQSPEALNSISIYNGNFYWQKSENEEAQKANNGSKDFMIRSLNLTVRKGEFIAFIGGFGSGKSSVLNAVLGEMYSEGSRIRLNGSVAYASQSPWIFNNTVKNNILFGEPFEEERYQKALHFSRLETDMRLFANGEDTMIGERGSTLSGGQKARISIARALYKQADIYIFDDVLSALDAHVTGFIFKQTLSRYLKGKTILLATHLVNYLDHVDRVFSVQNGNLSQVNYEKKQVRRFMRRKFTIYQEIVKPKDIDLPVQESNEKEYTDSELFKIFITRRGGVWYILFLVFIILFMIATSMILFIWLNTWMKASDNTSSYYFGIYVAALVANSVSNLLHCFIQYNSDFFVNFHRAMALNLLIAPMSYFETTSVSKTMNKLSSDLKKVDGEVIPQFRSTIYFIGLTTSFVANSIYVYIRKEQAFMIAAVLGLMLIITYCYFYFIVAIRQLHRLEQESMIPVFSSQVETMVGASTIRAYKREDFMRGKQTAYIEKYLATAKVMAGINSYSTFVISLITTIVTTGLLVKILLGDQENADFFLVYNIFSFQRSIENLHNILLDYLNSLKYLGYCEELMSIPQEEGYDLKKEGGVTQFHPQVNASWVKEGAISFEDFSVRYRPQLQEVIRGLSLRLGRREKLGVVGRTGSGKSTTILSLLRLLQSHAGTIRVDNSDIYALDLQTLRAGFSVILQEHFLFSGTVRDNIDPRQEFKDEDIIRALQSCGLWESIRARSGLQTVIEEGGGNFSAGEKQLMNIARTLLNPKPIVLVDEATASIDHKSDEMLQKVLKVQLKDSTIITIAHRIDTIIQSDRILVLDKGRIVELDSPQNLLKRPSIFGQLYKEYQNKKVEQAPVEEKQEELVFIEI